MNPRRAGRTQLVLLFLSNVAVVMYFWAQTSLPQIGDGLGPALIAIGRLCGLITVLLVLGQVYMISRVRWLENKIGFDGVTRYHRTNGMTLIFIMVAHPILISSGYAIENGTNPLSQYIALWQLPYVFLASLALYLFIILVALAALRQFRKYLTYEQWHATHLLMYVAILMAALHQFANGAELMNPVFRTYWFGLYGIVFAILIYFRLITPLAKTLFHGFVVHEVERITPSAVSVKVSGRQMDRFRYKPGQFNMWMFLAKGFIQKHPFTISIEPGRGFIRLSAKGVGDFTRKLRELPVGTRVYIEGPYGVFTPELTKNKKILMIAGGSGVTPLRAMLPQMLQEGRDVTMLYGNQTKSEAMLTRELDEMARDQAFNLHYVFSQDPKAGGEQGFIDREKVTRLVEDYAERDVFICGPPAMMNGVIDTLTKIGIPRNRIFAERFAL